VRVFTADTAANDTSTSLCTGKIHDSPARRPNHKATCPAATPAFVVGSHNSDALTQTWYHKTDASNGTPNTHTYMRGEAMQVLHLDISIRVAQSTNTKTMKKLK
jgi:hypothetical protein